MNELPRTGAKHALEMELIPQPPGERVRAELAAFYRTNERYIRQQHSHGIGYFARLLAVMNRVLIKPHAQVLEIGAGSAIALKTFLKRHPGTTAVALEMSPAGGPATGEASGSPLRGVTGTALQLPFKDRSFDAVVAFEVIEHLPDVRAALEEAVRVVRPPGHVIIGLPNHASLVTPIEDLVLRRTRAAFGVDRGRGALRWWKRNVALALKKRRSRDAVFLYREPVLDESAGGDADAVYYAAPLDLVRFFDSKGAPLVATSADARFGRFGRFIPVELQGSTVMAWSIEDAISR